ncbi:MAG TPA: phosphatidylglycerol lysyltransferase domain-containing protein [Terriglobales bacterium]|nr:phosphatidylglycerol lysyltransferase domain-containing protein [Terriglobales bacterium]
MAVRQQSTAATSAPRGPIPVAQHAERVREDALASHFLGHRRRFWIALAVAAVTFGSGVVNVFSTMGGPTHPKVLREIFPIEFIGLSRTLALLSGFALVITSLNILKRKKRAWAVAVALACASVVFHLTKGLDYEEALVSAALAILLLAARKTFSVRSSVQDFGGAVIRLLAAFEFAFVYGVAGFWFLDRHHFGINFHLPQAVASTIDLITFSQKPQLTPLTHYGAWFLDSVHIVSGVAVAYAGFALFRPIVYQFRTAPREHALAQQIANRHSRTALDYFKLWHDKSYYFSRTHRTFIAYRVARNVALALGDPVGPAEEVLPTIGAFAEYCRDNGWSVAFHQTLPDYLPEYRAAGLKRLKIGDDAIVRLVDYSLDGKSKKEFRYKVRQLETMGISFKMYPSPVPPRIVAELKDVSDEWLQIPGRRERTFTLGAFEENYIASTPVFVAEDSGGKILAFVNLTTLPNMKEASIDLMRRRTDAPNGVMEYLFVKLFLWARDQGYEKFNLGMAPMSGFNEREEARPEERAIHSFFQQLNFVFSFRGLRQYKAKFATSWEPRYLIYSQVTDLPKVALALRAVSEIEEKDNDDSDE